MAAPPTYPTLPGLGFSISWNPEFYNLPTQVTANGANIDLALASTPLHRFKLTYDFLDNRISPSEVKIYRGFWLRLQGTVGRFLFDNVEDNTVTAQLIGTGNDTEDTFSLVRTYGYGDNVHTDFVGYVDTVADFNVYVDAVLIDPPDYTLNQDVPGDIRVVFESPPADTLLVTVDMTYFYYCKFADNMLDFERFMENLITISEVNLLSCRAGT